LENLLFCAKFAHEIKLAARKTESPGVESFIFKPEAPLVWKAGQFLHYVLNHAATDDRGSDRWFTIASAPWERHVMLTTRFTAKQGSTFKKTLKGQWPSLLPRFSSARSGEVKGPGRQRLNLHLEFFALFKREDKTGEQFRDHFQIFQAHHLDGRMHVAIRQADECAGDAAARPENRIGVSAAR